MIPKSLFGAVLIFSFLLALAFQIKSIIGVILALSLLLLAIFFREKIFRQQVPSEISAPLIKKPIFGQIGLINIGNTCYMNTVLQCLISTHQLTSIFWGDNYKAGRNEDYSNKTDGSFVEQYHRFLTKMESFPNSPKAYDPTDLWKVIGQRNSSFRDKSQHDAQELILTILNNLHEDTNQIKTAPEYKQLSRKGKDEELSIIWDTFKKGYTSSKLNDILIGQFKSVETCKGCNTEQKNFDQFFVVNLPLLKSNLSDSKHDGMSLNSCLNEFRANLTSEYSCDDCNTIPSRRIGLYKTRDILIFALPRFTMNFTKVNNFIDFELKMNMKEHLECATGDLLYELYAVAYHYGSTLQSGHYIARCKQQNGEWYEYNDEYVSPLNHKNEEELRKMVVSRQASILFYRRVMN